MTEVFPKLQDRTPVELVASGSPQSFTTVYVDFGNADGYEMGINRYVTLVCDVTPGGSTGIKVKPLIQMSGNTDWQTLMKSDSTIIEWDMDDEADAARILDTFNVAEKVKFQVKAGNTGGTISGDFIKTWS